MTKQIEQGRGDAVHRRQALKFGAGSVALAAAGVVFPSQAKGAEEKVSSFGVYKGYSTPSYDGWVRTAQYVPVRDGTRLAVDVFRPTAGKVLHKDRLPVVWQGKRYQRAIVQPDGSVITGINTSYNRTAQTLIKHGYVIASVDRRGTGASFGTQTDLSNPQDALDGYDITEWLAAQPWSDGKIGMFGASYEGEIQLRIASTKPPHLKAITPEVSPFDWYELVHTGGIYREFYIPFAKSTAAQDANTNNGPVDSDKDRALLTAALAGHKAKNDYSAPAGKMPFRDSKNPVTGEQSWLNRHGGHYAAGLSPSGVPAYHRSGIFAYVTLDQLLWYTNQKSPKKLIIGPGPRGGAATEEEKAIWATESHRWFDYWLKGVQNGIMDEPPIHAAPIAKSRVVMTGQPWRTMRQWPLPNEQRTEFFFGAGQSGTVQSRNDGKLSRAAPKTAKGQDDCTTRYDLDYGDTQPVGMGEKPNDYAKADAQGLTYTSAPLESDMEVTGHPSARLWLSSTAPDADVFLKLEDVGPSGDSVFVNEGCLRASCRTLGKAPYDFLGAPWNTCRESDATPLVKGQAAELVFPLRPMSYLFQRGRRIRVTILSSDLSIGHSPKFEPPPVISLHRAAGRASSITLPIIPA